MLFQGQEFAASAPFVFFADHKPELAKLVARGRKDFLKQFPSVADPAVQEHIPEPSDRATFEMCRLDHEERQRHAHVVALHRDLLRLRREQPFAEQRADLLDGSVLGEECLALRWLAGADRERLLIVNLGRDLHLDPAPDPLLAPPHGFERWTIHWTSEAPLYGGSGTPEADTEENWKIAGHSAIVLKPE